jgi:aminoglycoside 3-N-acetyltransferase
MGVDYRKLPLNTAGEIAGDLRALGLVRGDRVLVHSSLSRIGNVEGGAEAVVDALLEVLGPEGTLAVPTFPFDGSMLEYLLSDPPFDAETTPSKMGAISEAVRRRPGAIRSLEPTHPVSALGPAARLLTHTHARSEGSCDRESPFWRLAELGGKVLLLGVDFRNCTLLHGAEELARVPFIDFDTRYPLRGRAGGEEYRMDIFCHSTSHPPNFPAIEPVLLEQGQLRIGMVGQAEARLALASDILHRALERLREDPFFLRTPIR